MNSAMTTKQNVEIIPLNGVEQHVQSFCIKMTAEQWHCLKYGDPDESTKIMLAEMVVEMIQGISGTLLHEPEFGIEVSKDNLQSCIGDMIVQSFNKIMATDVDIQDVDPKQLEEMIWGEVVNSVNSAQSTRQLSAEPVIYYVTPPARLEKLTAHTQKLFQRMTLKLKNICCPPKPRKEKKQTIPSFVIVEDNIPVKDKDGVSVCSDERQPAPTSDDTIPVDSAVTSQTFEAIIFQEVSAVIEPLLDVVAEPLCEQLRSDTCEEIEDVADVVMSSVAEALHILEEPKSARSGQRLTQKLNQCLEGVRGKIKNIFTKAFTRASFYCMMAQLTRKFHLKPIGDSQESVESIGPSVEPLLQILDEGNIGSENEETCQTISHTKVLVFTQALNDFLNTYTDGDFVNLPAADTETDIQHKVNRFLAILNWWLYTEASKNSNRVILALKDAIKSASPKLKMKMYLTPTAEDVASAKDEMNKLYANILVRQLITLTTSKAKVIQMAEDPEEIVARLFKIVWSKVKATGLNFNLKKFDKLPNLIYKDLCKTYGCPEMILIAMYAEDVVLDKRIISSLSYHLTKQPVCAFRRFVSAFSRCFGLKKA